MPTKWYFKTEINYRFVGDTILKKKRFRLKITILNILIIIDF